MIYFINRADILILFVTFFVSFCNKIVTSGLTFFTPWNSLICPCTCFALKLYEIFLLHSNSDPHRLSWQLQEIQGNSDVTLGIKFWSNYKNTESYRIFESLKEGTLFWTIFLHLVFNFVCYKRYHYFAPKCYSFLSAWCYIIYQ